MIGTISPESSNHQAASTLLVGSHWARQQLFFYKVIWLSWSECWGDKLSSDNRFYFEKTIEFKCSSLEFNDETTMMILL